MLKTAYIYNKFVWFYGYGRQIKRVIFVKKFINFAWSRWKVLQFVWTKQVREIEQELVRLNYNFITESSYLSCVVIRIRLVISYSLTIS